MLTPEIVLRRVGGIATNAQLRRFGFSDKVLGRLVGSGRLRRLRRGVYSLPTVDPLVAEANAHGGVLTCESVLRRRGVWVPAREPRPHVWVPSEQHCHLHPGCRCVVHRFRGSPGVGVADLATALIHYRRCAGDEMFFAAFESALHQHLLSAAEREKIRAALPRHARRLVDLAGDKAESGLESLTHLRLRQAGLRVELQFAEHRRRYDLLVEGLLIVELDGAEHHADPATRGRDLRKDAEASVHGYETLRFSYAQVIYEWEQTQRAIIAGVERLRGRQ